MRSEIKQARKNGTNTILWIEQRCVECKQYFLFLNEDDIMYRSNPEKHCLNKIREFIGGK